MISNQRTSDSERLSLASDILLAPAQLGTDQLQSLLGGKLAGRADYADVYFQHSRHEAWILEDGLVRDASFNLERGAGVRLVSGDKTGFAYSDDISLDALTQAGSAAAAIGRQGKDQSVRIGAAKTMPARYPALDPLPGWSSEMKVALLQEMDRLARSLDPAVKEVTVSLSGEQDVVLVAATDGTLAADVRPLIRFNISVIAERGGRRERGSAGGGGRVAYDWLREDGRLEAWTRDAVRQALLNLDAEPAPAGTMPVVLGPGWPGVLLHEAVGHGLEGDFNRKGTSMFAKMMGQQVASSLCTVVDDGTLLPLNPTTHPNSFLHRSDPSDVARTEHLTYVCTTDPEVSGPNNQWMSPADGHAKVDDLFAGAMKGRTLYVVPYCMGPIASPIARCGVEITDSPYVVANMRLMTRMGAAALAQQSDDGVAKLRENVTSPGGTTEQALLSLQSNQFEAIVSEAVRQCAARAAALGKEFG